MLKLDIKNSFNTNYKRKFRENQRKETESVAIQREEAIACKKPKDRVFTHTKILESGANQNETKEGAKLRVE